MAQTLKNVSWLLLLVFVTWCVTKSSGRRHPCAKSRCIKYKVLKKIGGYELREYEASNWAAYEYNDQSDEPYKALYAYFDGANSEKRTLPLADPIQIRVATATSAVTILMLLPPGRNPKPDNPHIKLESYGPLQFHTLPMKRKERYGKLKAMAGNGKFSKKYIYGAIYENYSEMWLLKPKNST